MVDRVYVDKIKELENRIRELETENRKMYRVIDLCIEYQQQSGSSILYNILKDYYEETETD